MAILLMSYSLYSAVKAKKRTGKNAGLLIFSVASVGYRSAPSLATLRGGGDLLFACLLFFSKAFGRFAAAKSFANGFHGKAHAFSYSKVSY